MTIRKLLLAGTAALVAAETVEMEPVQAMIDAEPVEEVATTEEVSEPLELATKEKKAEPVPAPKKHEEEKQAAPKKEEKKEAPKPAPKPEPKKKEAPSEEYYYISAKEADHLTHEAGVGAHEFYQMVKPKFLGAHDPVAVSFWIISICMVAATVFFIYECMAVNDHWRTSLTVGALVTLVAAVHYFYMREYWVTYYQSPTVYRYIDWTITVPLQMIEFYLILSACGKVPAGVFWRLLIGTVVMLLFGYMGEAHIIGAVLGFVVGIAGWLFILYEVFAGEASSIKAGANTPEPVQYAYNTMRMIVSVGWSIYPLGYYFGFLMGSVSATSLNFIYNVADLVNKIAFCLAIWAAAKRDTEANPLKAGLMRGY